MKIRNIVCLILFFLSCQGFASGEEVNISEALFGEISNGKTLNIFPGLPAIQLPLGITVHFFMILLVAGIIVAMFLYGRQKTSLKPKGLLVVLESAIFFVQDDIVFPIMGKTRGKVWLPFFCTLFLFILSTNLLGLIPAFKTATGNINVTTALAIMIFVLIFVIGMKNLGIIKFFKNFYPVGVPWPIGIFVVFLEFVGVFIKTMVLSLRLFANMFAGHLAIISFLMLIFILSPLSGIVAVPFALFTEMLEVIIGIIQALVFTLLSCIFITMASSVHE